MPRGPWIDHFGDNFLWSNATLIIKGMAPYGVVALEEMDRACERLRLRQHEPNAWWEEWGALGDEIERRAEAAAAKGHKHTAGDYYLRDRKSVVEGKGVGRGGQRRREQE